MREAIGGSMMLYFILPIIVLIVVFITFIINYASAYRAANYVVTQIENCQGQVDNCGGEKDYLKVITENVKKQYKYITQNGKKIVPCYIDNGNNSYVFRVDLPVSFDLPLLGNFAPARVKVETKTITNVPAKSLTEFSQCA